MTTSSSLLVSFCNVDIEGLVLGRLNADTLHFRWVDLKSPKPLSGATGLCISNELSIVFVALAYADGTSGVAALNATLDVAFSRELQVARDIHSIVWWRSELWMVDTAHDRLTAIGFDRENGFGPRERVAWTYCSGETDQIHLNSVVVHDNNLYVSAFGKRGNTWRDAQDGFVLNVSAGTVVFPGLHHPHTLISSDGSLYVLESRSGCLWRIGDSGPILARQLSGYVRGAVITPDRTIVGSSAVRTRSKSTGTLNMLEDDPVATTECRLTLFSRHSVNSVLLSPFGSEVYDILALDASDATPDGSTTLHALDARISGYQQLLAALAQTLDTVASVNRSLQLDQEALRVERNSLREQNAVLLDRDEDPKGALQREEYLSQLNARIASLTDSLAEANNALNDVVNSQSWRLTAPLRRTLDWLLGIGQRTRA